jgi:DNA polymerase III epsilon subunit-like protein
MFECQLCNGIFKSKPNLVRHLRLRKTPCIEDVERWNVKRFQLVDNLKVSKKVIKPEEEIKEEVSKYNEKQTEFINSGLDNIRLMGIPGGGKTTSIIAKIVEMKSTSKIESSSEILILTFSRRAKEDFLKKGVEVDKKLFTKDNIRTIHSLAGCIVSKCLNKKSSNMETIVASAYNVINKEIGDIGEIKCLKNCKMLFVDEAQDISEVQYKLVKILQDNLGLKLVMVGDPNQNIYQFQNGSDKYLMNHDGKPITLVDNYRSSVEIVNFINHFRPWKNELEVMKSATNKRGNKPIVYCQTILNILKHIIREIKTAKCDPSEIAIIGPVKMSKPNEYGDYASFGLQLVVNCLEENGIQYQQCYSVSSDDRDANNGKFKSEEGKVNLLTIHGAKGLEFEKVLLLNFHLTTFSRRPNLREYNEFKYLWYVGLSRAISDLVIYVDKDKMVWSGLVDCPKELYKKQGLPIKYAKTPISNEEDKPLMFGITDVIGDKKYFGEEVMYEVENMLNYSFESEVLFDKPEQQIDLSNHGALYGIYIENVFDYHYSVKFGKIPTFIQKIKERFSNIIEIPMRKESCISGFRSLKVRLLLPDVLSLGYLSEYKNCFNNNEKSLYEFLWLKLAGNLSKTFSILVQNSVSQVDIKQLMNDCKRIMEGENRIFQVSLYLYQLENEAKYLLKQDFSEEIGLLDNYVKSIKDFVGKYENRNCELQVENRHPNIPLIGVADIVDRESESIIDIKFTKTVGLKHVLQLLMYYNNIHSDWKCEKKLEIWNFYQGVKYIIKVDEGMTNYSLLKILCKVLDVKMSNNVFLYDLETTDLQGSEIIERYIEEMNLGFIASEGLIKSSKPLDKVIVELTGIRDEDFEGEDQTMGRFYSEMADIYEYCDNPIFIAHNGTSFDHRIMKEKGLIRGEESRLLDSRTIIRLFIDDKVFFKKLSEIYQMVVGREMKDIHRAKADTVMIREIFERLEVSNDYLVNFVY